MNLKLAEKKDSKTLFSWRNEKSVRLQSINTDLIPWETHMVWFKKSLLNHNRKIYLAEVDGQKVGMIRIDKDKMGHELSWLIDPKFRGNGYGRQMLLQIVESLSGRLRARIKVDNVPSLAMVRKLGFQCVSSENNHLSEWVLEK